MTLDEKECALVVVALARYAVTISESIEACERDVPGLSRSARGVLADDLAMLDRLVSKIQAEGLAASAQHARPSDLGLGERLVGQMRKQEFELIAQAIRDQVAKFSDQRLNDGDDVWRERELEYRCAVAQTANAICVALGLDAQAFAAACGLYVSDGRDSYSDCHPGELTWEKPWTGGRS